MTNTVRSLTQEERMFITDLGWDAALDILGEGIEGSREQAYLYTEDSSLEVSEEIYNTLSNVSTKDEESRVALANSEEARDLYIQGWNNRVDTLIEE